MWFPDEARLTKVRLQDQGADVETAWAEDLGPATVAGARRVRLANVPFLHTKPTYEDVIVAVPDAEGILTWDRDGVAWEHILTCIDVDSKRWVMIVDYAPSADADTNSVFSALDVAAGEIDVCFEGCFGPRNGKPGRAYLAVPATLTTENVLAYLRKQLLPVESTLAYPHDDGQFTLPPREDPPHLRSRSRIRAHYGLRRSRLYAARWVYSPRAPRARKTARC